MPKGRAYQNDYYYYIMLLIVMQPGEGNFAGEDFPHEDAKRIQVANIITQIK
jgi:hypothetical protein